jgi:1-acyl-sn-glycerol-3-phosphate acyltransferase
MALRSVLFNVLFYALMVAVLVFLLPVLSFGRGPIMSVVGWFGRVSMAMHRAITGIRHEVRGFDSVPRDGCLVVMKHQSTWETLALVPYLSNPVFVLKKELMRIPLFGWWASRAQMIPVDRTGGLGALAEMTERAKAAVAAGRQIVIFPEGTRTEPGAAPDYKLGVAYLYRDLGIPMIPVALNSGLFWPRRTLVHRKGTIVAEVLPPIPAGLETRAAFRRMRDEIEAGCDRLLAEAAAAGADLPPEAAARIAPRPGPVTPAA